MADEWCSPWWLERIAALTEAFADGIPDDFLSLPAVQGCGLTVNDPAATAAQLRELTATDIGPAPMICPETYGTDMAHLTHLLRAGVLTEYPELVHEVGAGYGSMARLTRSLSAPPRHVIIDLPVMLDLQEHYLAKHGIPTRRHWTAAREAVTLLDSRWLADLGLGHGCETPDVLLGTFSISECTKAAHDWFIDHDWLGARTVLLAMQPSSPLFPDGASLYERLRSDPEWVESPTHFPPAVYMVRKR